MGEIDLVEFGGGGAWVTNGGEVSDDVFGRITGIRPVAFVVMVVAMVFVIVVFVLVMIARAQARAEYEFVIACATSHGVLPEAADDEVVACAAIE